MIIDIHTHIFPDKVAAAALDKLSRAAGIVAFTDGTAKGLLASMRSAGVDWSVILPVATSVGQVEKINSAALELNKNYADKGLLSFGGIHPDYAGYRRELKRLVENGISGIKIHPVYQGTNIDDIKYLRILDCAAELGLTVITHAGLDIGFPGEVRCSPAQILRVIKAVGDFKFVLAHMGGWRNWQEAVSLLADTTAYIDTSFSFGRIHPLPTGKNRDGQTKLLDEEDLPKFVEFFGAERILFGTDSPWTGQKDAVNFIKNSVLDTNDKAKILGGNAENLLRLAK